MNDQELRAIYDIVYAHECTFKAFATDIRALLADGGKGEAALQRLTEEQERLGLYDDAPQAECAPREAQPVGPRTTLNYDGTFDTTCAHCGGNGCFACLKSAAPTPERADADTAGAKPTCPHCGLTDIEFSRVCHNSACSGYAKEESFYRGWENTAAPASQERADAGKDAALNTLFEILMLQNIVTGAESYLSLRCVGVPPDQEEFVQAVKRAILAAKEKES
jgi:hypothetical protein